jgi:hypothetical protein
MVGTGRGSCGRLMLIARRHQMTDTLPRVTHEHHDALIPHIDALAAVAEAIDKLPPEELAERLAAEHRFITSQLVPHMEQAETTVYAELERLLQNRHSMTPMRHEHDLVRHLVAELAELQTRSAEFGVRLRLRRILYRLYAILRTHLAEEEAYLAVLERNLSREEQDELARGMAHATADPL